MHRWLLAGAKSAICDCLVVTGAVYGRLDVNVALKRPTFASSEWHTGYDTFVASRTVDGNNDTDAVQLGNSCFMSNLAANPWWAVDLGTALAVIGVVFTNYGNLVVRI